MIDVPAIQTFDQELSWVSEIFTNFEGLLVDVLRGEVLCDTAVICVAELALVIARVEQVVHVDIVYVALYFLEVWI